MRQALGCGLALAGLVLFVSGPGLALSFHFSSGSIKIYARPGQVVNREFTLTLAKGEEPTHFKAHVEDWWRSEDGKQSFYREPATLKRSCAGWVRLNPVEAAAQPEETLKVRVSVVIPEGAGPGGYWCALTVDEVPDPTREPPGIGVRFLASVSVGIFVYLPPLERAARITEVQILPEEARVRLRNEGNCPLAVEGRFEFLRPGESRPVAVARLARGTLLPEPITTGLFSVKLPDAAALPSGRYLVRAILDIGLDHYLGVQKETEIERVPPSPSKRNQ
jgi:hypothetical protein